MHVCPGVVHSLKTMSLKTIHYSQVFSSLIIIFYDDLRKLRNHLQLLKLLVGTKEKVIEYMA